MSSLQPKSPQQICEDLLYEGKRYNIEHQILPSENAVADRLLARGTELKDAYQELHEKLYLPALKVFLDLLLSTAAFWNPEKINAARTARNEIANINQQVARKAAELADLLERRSELHNTSGFSSNTHYHVCDVIEAASEHNYLYQTQVKKHLDALCYQFDLKYWPSLSQFLEVVSSDAESALMEATDPITAAATTSSRNSRADFFKALFAVIELSSSQRGGLLPAGLKLTDSALASLANCALGLDADDLVDSAYVKRLRQRERNGSM